jgi:hypothetical protein
MVTPPTPFLHRRYPSVRQIVRKTRLRNYHIPGGFAAFLGDGGGKHIVFLVDIFAFDGKNLLAPKAGIKQELEIAPELNFTSLQGSREKFLNSLSATGSFPRFSTMR